MKKLEELFTEFLTGSFDNLEALAEELSELEHQADLTKNDIRNHLPRSILLPIDRSQLLEILSMQDTLADKAEELGNLLILRPLNRVDSIHSNLSEFFQKNLDAFWDVREITREMKDLVESTFGGKEAAKVKDMIDTSSYKEYESDVMMRKLLKNFFTKADSLSTPEFFLWTRLIEEIGTISHLSEKLAMRMRLMLEN